MKRPGNGWWVRSFIFLAVLFGAVASAASLPEPATDADYRSYPSAWARLGQVLFYDRVLSGTYRVSCATCHHHDRGSSNGARLDGREETVGDALATGGHEAYNALKPSARAAPTLFNLGAHEFKTLFLDGRVSEVDGTFASPVGSELPKGLRDILAVQALFPTITGDELVGTVDNDLKAAARDSNRAVWDVLVARVRDLPEYVPLFTAAFMDVHSASDISIDHIANALSAFVGSEWRSDGAPFDRHLRGEDGALSGQQIHGMALFYGEASCAKCHSGTFQTDHQFHASAILPPKIVDDVQKTDVRFLFGRFNVTGLLSDVGKVRTPSLRNVARTPPYGIAGAVDGLAEVLDHHHGQDLPPRDRAALVAYLESLTDPKALRGRLGKPHSVPSSLALD